MIRNVVVSADPATVRRVARDITKQQGIRADVIQARHIGDHELVTIEVRDGFDLRPIGLTLHRVAILNLIADGLSAQEIADRNGVTLDVTKRTIHAIYRRLGAKDRAHAVMIACRAGLIRDSAS